jgi:hypothetical protein
MIVLYEFLRNAEVGEHALVVALEEEAARVTEYLGLEDEGAFKWGEELVHAVNFSWSVMCIVIVAIFDRVVRHGEGIDIASWNT